MADERNASFPALSDSNGNTAVRLNQVIGRHVLKFLDGVDAANFIEAVDRSEEFGPIAETSDHHFVRLINFFSDCEKILLPRVLFYDFMGDNEIDEQQLIVVPARYSSTIQPFERLYIHPYFGLECFSKLCEAYQTSLFKCYCRLLPFNTTCYHADFGLLDYEWYGHTVGMKRLLNDHEKTLFKVYTNFPAMNDQNHRKNMIFVHTLDEFKNNLAARFASGSWLEAIDFSKFVIVGGCVLNSLSRSSFPDIKEQDVNLVYYADNDLDFETTVLTTVNILKKKIVSPDLTNIIQVEKMPGSSCYHAFLPCKIRLTFSLPLTGTSKRSLSHILHNLDADISQVAFNGNKIISTFPFLQALATRSFIVFSLHAGSPKHLCTRIAKYYNRGFDLLVPINFDGNLELMMAQEENPVRRVEYQHYIDDDGEIRIATKEFHRIFAHNVDTFRLQEKFISMVCPRLLRDI